MEMGEMVADDVISELRQQRPVIQPRRRELERPKAHKRRRHAAHDGPWLVLCVAAVIYVTWHGTVAGRQGEFKSPFVT